MVFVICNLGFFNDFFCLYVLILLREAKSRKISHIDAECSVPTLLDHQLLLLVLLLLLWLLLLFGLIVGTVTGLQPISLGHNESFRIFSWIAQL